MACYGVIESQRISKEKMSNSAVNAVPTDGLVMGKDICRQNDNQVRNPYIYWNDMSTL